MDCVLSLPSASPYDTTTHKVNEENTFMEIKKEELDYSINSPTQDEYSVVETRNLVTKETPITCSSIKPDNTTPEISPSPEVDAGAKQKAIDTVFSPAMDVIETKDSYHIYAEVPGMNCKDISVDLTDNTFTLSGNKQDRHSHIASSVGKQSGVLLREISSGKFKRVLELPENANKGAVSVSFEEGVLQCKIRKLETKEQEGGEQSEEKREAVADENNTDHNIMDLRDKNEEKRNSKKKPSKRSSCIVQ